jgi:hypothetical protein
MELPLLPGTSDASQTAIQALIDESAQLEDLGGRIQGRRNPGVDPDAIDGFSRQYQRWFADCLAALPHEFHERFRGEYAGGLFSAKIKAFLEGPTEVSPFFNEDEPNPLIPYWQNPYETAFRGPFLSQRQILFEADRLTRTAVVTPEALQLVEVICRRFPELVVGLSKRRLGRAALQIADEYDLQDLLHGLLRVFFDDVRPEELSPSRGGGARESISCLRVKRSSSKLRSRENAAARTRSVRKSSSTSSGTDHILMHERSLSLFTIRTDRSAILTNLQNSTVKTTISSCA